MTLGEIRQRIAGHPATEPELTAIIKDIKVLIEDARKAGWSEGYDNGMDDARNA